MQNQAPSSELGQREPTVIWLTRRVGASWGSFAREEAVEEEEAVDAAAETESGRSAVARRDFMMFAGTVF